MSLDAGPTEQDRGMYCSHCGTESNSPKCSVCGKQLMAQVNSHHDVATGLALSGWWRRVGATVSDDLILVIPTLVVGSLFAQLHNNLTGALAGLALGGVYMIKLLSGPRGQTLGNRVVATCVRDAHSGQAISVAQACKRWGFIAAYSAIEITASPASVYIVALIALVDNLYPLFDVRKQTLHDKFAGTLVVMT